MACSANHSKGAGSAVGAGLIVGQPGWLQRKIHLRPQHRGVHLVTEEILRQVIKANNCQAASAAIKFCEIRIHSFKIDPQFVAANFSNFPINRNFPLNLGSTIQQSVTVSRLVFKCSLHGKSLAFYSPWHIWLGIFSQTMGLFRFQTIDYCNHRKRCY